ncbi:hypothetical protein EDD11_000942 [Mortierella claussenii]|nr:hypothetical protein EDD11_000942 [Mortierella claussenii]
MPGHDGDDDDEDINILRSLEEDHTQPETLLPLGLKEAPPHVSAVTIVGSTPAFGIAAFQEQQDAQNHDDDNGAMYAAEPPKKKQRSTAAVLLGAAFETVIFTSAVALSAYQLLTGKGKYPLDANMASPVDPEMAKTPSPGGPQGHGEPIAEKAMTQSAPVDIPSRATRHGDAGLLGKSLHHNAYRHSKSKHHHHGSSKHRSRHGLHGISTSLPHAYGHDDIHMKGVMALPGRPNTGTEDNDEQFLRMEAQLTTLIAEGKRALSSRISDWGDV